MSDPTGWQAPGAQPSPPPQYGEYAPPGSAQQGSGQPGYPPPGYGSPYGAPYAPPPGWTPAPRPGLIPLRPLSFGEVLATPFQLLRRNPRPLIGASLLLQGVVTVISLLLVGLVTGWAVGRIDDATDASRQAVTAGSVTAIVLAAVISVVLTLLASGLLQGIVAVETARGALGQKLGMAALWRATRGSRWSLFRYLLLLAAAWVVIVALLAAAVAAFAVLLGGVGGVVAAVLTGVFGGLGVGVLAAWIYPKTALAPSAIVLEHVNARAGIARSWRLTRGGFWRTFGAIVLVAMICGVASEIVQVPISLVLGLTTSTAFPTGNPTLPQLLQNTGTSVSFIVTILVSLLIGTITQVIESGASAVVYLDQRMRHEGLDLVLQKHVEAVAAGEASDADPFAFVPTAAATSGGATPSAPPAPPAKP